MLDAYVGTIDYEGETIAEARTAIGEYLEDRPLLDCSFVLEHRGDLIAAVLASLWRDDQPLISYAITAGPHKRAGSAAALLGHVLAALREVGYSHVHAVITNGNVASEGLFRAAGFAVVDHPPSGN
jgi:L-amino acid N-acyltransferase YncA